VQIVAFSVQALSLERAGAGIMLLYQIERSVDSIKELGEGAGVALASSQRLHDRALLILPERFFVGEQKFSSVQSERPIIGAKSAAIQPGFVATSGVK
jgi:hypothetical protein